MPIEITFQADIRQSSGEEHLRSTELEAEDPRFLIVDTVFGGIWTGPARISREEEDIFATKALVHLREQISFCSISARKGQAHPSNHL